MTQHQTVPAFTDVNNTLIFLKPELRLFVSDVYTSLGQTFSFAGGSSIPQSFLTLIDIEKEDWSDEQRKRFYIENFTPPYDIIECSVQQLEAVTFMCSQTQMPKALVLHANKGEEDISLPPGSTKFFIVVGKVTKIRVTENKSDLIVFHGARDPEGTVSFYLEGAPIPVEDLEVDYRPIYKIPLDDPRLEKELRGCFRPAGAPPDPDQRTLIRQFGPNDHLGDDGKGIYNISGSDSVKGFTQYASIIAPAGNSGIDIADVRNQEQLTAREKEMGRTVIVHGRIKASKQRSMIRMDANKRIHVLFPDMSQKEVDSILLNHKLLFGNDRLLPSAKELQGNIPSLYFTDRFTLSEQILYPHVNIEDQSLSPERHKRIALLAKELENRLHSEDKDPSQTVLERISKPDGRQSLVNLMLSRLETLNESRKDLMTLFDRLEKEFDPKKTLIERMFHREARERYTCLSYIDNYFDSIRLKYPNGFFQYMITKYAAELEVRNINFAALRSRPSIYSFIAAVKERLQSESKVASNRREIMLARIQALVRNQRSIPPYYLESAVDDPVLSEEQRFREKHHFSNKHDPMTQERSCFILQSTEQRKETGKPEQYVISGVNYMILDGENYDCVIHNCGFVILRGTGNVRVSGTLHSLVCYGGVEIELDNVSPMAFRPDTFLFTENGSIYDTITNYKDNLPPKAIYMITEPRTVKHQEKGVTPDVLQDPPENPVPAKFCRSVVRNLYVTLPPENHLTAMIENLVILGY